MGPLQGTALGWERVVRLAYNDSPEWCVYIGEGSPWEGTCRVGATSWKWSFASAARRSRTTTSMTSLQLCMFPPRDCLHLCRHTTRANRCRQALLRAPSLRRSLATAPSSCYISRVIESIVIEASPEADAA